jgi:hypothetical protein
VDLVDKPTVGTSCGSFALRQTLVPVFTRRVSTRSTSSFQLNMPHQSSPLIHHLSLQDSDFCSHYIPEKEHREFKGKVQSFAAQTQSAQRKRPADASWSSNILPKASRNTYSGIRTPGSARPPHIVESSSPSQPLDSENLVVLASRALPKYCRTTELTCPRPVVEPVASYDAKVTEATPATLSDNGTSPTPKRVHYCFACSSRL